MLLRWTKKITQNIFPVVNVLKLILGENKIFIDFNLSRNDKQF